MTIPKQRLSGSKQGVSVHKIDSSNRALSIQSPDYQLLLDLDRIIHTYSVCGTRRKGSNTRIYSASDLSGPTIHIKPVVFHTSAMSVEEALPAAVPEEVSGWWPSERSAKSRLKALFGRTKIDKLTGVHKTEQSNPHQAQTQSSGQDSGSAPTSKSSEQPKGSSTWPTRTLRISQRNSKASRLIRAQKSLPNLFQASSQKPVEEISLESPPLPVHPPPTPQPNPSRNVSRSTTDSSTYTMNSLDNLRERSISGNYSVSTTHTSFSSYTGYPMHTIDTSFSGTDDYGPPLLPELTSVFSTPTSPEAEELGMYMPTPRRTSRPQPRRTFSLDTPAAAANEEVYERKPLPALPQQLPVSDTQDRRISTVAPLPEPGHIRKISARYRCDSRGGAVTKPSTPTSPTQRPSSVESMLSTATYNSEGGHKQTPSYSLFPRTPSMEHARISSRDSQSPCSSPVTSSTPTSTTPIPGPGLSTRSDRSPSDPIAPFRTRSAKRHGTLLPLDTNAATSTTTIAKTSPPTTTNPAQKLPYCLSCPDSAASGDLKPPVPLRLRVAKAPARVPAPAPAPAARFPSLTRQKSTPSLHAARALPSGPPPQEPLPALPGSGDDVGSSPPPAWTQQVRWVSLPKGGGAEKDQLIRNVG